MSAAKESPTYRITDGGLWANAWKVSLTVTLLGAVGCVAGYMADPHRFAFSYLTAMVTALTLVFGAIFLVVIQHLSSAFWGVTTRRIAEFVLAALPVLAILFVPLGLSMNTLFEWSGTAPESAEHAAPEARSDASGELTLGVAHAQEGDEALGEQEVEHTDMEVALHHELLEHKAPWLNRPYVLVRTVVYFAVWLLIGLGYFRWSTRQDKTRDHALTVKMKQAAPLAFIGFASTMTFFSFDWIMGLEPNWYSTIFGVYIFSGSAVAILALVIVLSLSLMRSGHLGDAVNLEHLHDLGKFFFGFFCFWAYIAFSQWMLIWYAGIPEEATYFHRRWAGGWQAVGYILIFGHFVLPFLFFMSRVIKRRVNLLRLTAIWMLLMHVVDVYWLVMPYATQEPHFAVQYIDVAAMLFVLGAFFTTMFVIMKRYPLVPVGDPRLPRSLHFHQTQ
ncbi:MAG: hypothetical protein GXP55_12220 [Deltaproteobacteria bacterium]|nr:hypothetical protein [Deltaproteobacteria bacterium]